MKNTVIGIDISKKSTDWCLMRGTEIVSYHRVDNEASAIEKQLQELMDLYLIDSSDLMVCAEHTGHYIYPLAVACQNKQVDLWLESGYNIKCEARKERGKSDKEDSRRIAEYGYKNQADARYYSIPEHDITVLESLLSERSDYVVERAKLEGQLNDQKGYSDTEVYKAKAKRLKKLIRQYDKLIEETEKELERLMKENKTMGHQAALLETIPGVGRQTAMRMIAATRGFTLFENGRQFCCYAGTAPFEYTSGTSIRSKHRVSQRADKSLKAMLHLCALTVSRRCKQNHFSDYYQRKVDEGKNPMSVLNAIRSKLVLTMFALIRTDKPYSTEIVHNYVEKFSLKPIAIS